MSFAAEALEMQLATLKQLQQFYAHPETRKGVTPGEHHQWITDMHCLSRATPFYWGRRTTELVTAMMRDFKLEEIISARHLVYTDVGWCWFGEQAPFEIELRVQDSMPNRVPCRAISWYWFGVEKQYPFLGLTAWAPVAYSRVTKTWAGPPAPVIWSATPIDDPMSVSLYGEEVTFQGHDDERTQVEMKLMKLFIIAANTFMRQKLLDVQEEPLDRYARKRLEKQVIQRPGARLPLVHSVHLRQRQAPKSTPSSDSKPVDWQVQWSVRGHVRQQWFPSLNEHLPRYIHPYLKGPEDKPMKPRATPIYEVTR